MATKKIEAIALCVDIDGEINIVAQDGTIHNFVPAGHVHGLTEVRNEGDEMPVTWMFVFKKPVEIDLVRDVVLDYLSRE